METMHVRIRYRKAKHVLSAKPDHECIPSPTFEKAIRDLLNGSLGSDVSSRLLPTIEDERHSVCLHFSTARQGSVSFDLLHLDDRKELPTWKKPKKAMPISTISGAKIPAGEMSLNEPAFLMVAGNHVAVIERIGLRTPTIENYLNQILEKHGSIKLSDSYWRLLPKIETQGSSSFTGGVEKIILKPRAALAGEGQSVVSDKKKTKGRRTRKIDEFISYGEKIFEMLQGLGAHETDIDKLRQKMSSDLVLKAKIEISVSKAERASEAKISTDDIQSAFAHMSETSEIEIIDRDGKTNGKLVQLTHSAEVQHKNGLIDSDSAMNALAAAMSSWAAKGAIDLP